MAQTLSSETVVLFVWLVNGSLAVMVLALALLLFADGSPVRALSRSRMGAMLARWGIDPVAYAQVLSTPELRSQLAACRDCANTGVCAAFVAGQAAANESLAFCPNAPALARFTAFPPPQPTRP